MGKNIKNAQQSSPAKKPPGKKEARGTRRSGSILAVLYGQFEAIKDQQVNPLKGTLLHADFKRIDLTKRVRVVVPVFVNGEPVGVKTQGGRLNVTKRNIEIETLPDEIPENYTIDVGDMVLGDSCVAGDIVLSGSTKLVSNPQTVIAQVVGDSKKEVAPRSGELDTVAVRGGLVEGLTRTWASIHAPVHQIQAVVKLAIDVFESEQVAEEWLNTPNLATNEEPPLALLGTDAGYDRVRTLLLRIDYGVLT